MKVIAQLLVGLVAALHIGFFGLEAFHWKGLAGLGHEQAGMSVDGAKESANLAINQGIYNGFFAVGLIWALFAGERGRSVKYFVLICAVVAGVAGALLFQPINPVFLLLQSLPAAVALGAVWRFEATSGLA
jgi:putative membrane protein